MTFSLLKLPDGEASFIPVTGAGDVRKMPYALRILLENVLRRQALAGEDMSRQVADLMGRNVGAGIAFRPSRIYGQDILAKVMMVDMAAFRDALAAAGRDPALVNPAVPVDIIIDHSLQVDAFGTREAARLNLDMEYRRNAERFAFLRWCAESFRRVRVVPPGKGIMHQIHVERLAEVVWSETVNGRRLLSPDTCVGTDSHTPMVNGIGVLGWGVGGIEAEAVMLGKAVSMALPRVVGVEVTGALGEGVMPTDLLLTIAQTLRKVGVVGDFVEFFGPGVMNLSVADRAAIANMAPEYGATAVYFPIDARTTDYLTMTARPAAHIAMIEAYARAQHLWREADMPTPDYDAVVPLNLSAVRPSIAGPRNPEERIDLSDAAAAFAAHNREFAGRAPSTVETPVAGESYGVKDGDVVIAAITSCTNTSNPFGMIAAGLVARNAVARGLTSRPWVKTSLTPGSHVAAAVLERCGLQSDLDALGFHVAGFGCGTCNGSSGPLARPIADAVEAGGIVATAVVSGNRNFQGRIHPNVRAAYLASPALVVAYAIAGSTTIDLTRAPLGTGADGQPVYLKDIWPSSDEINALVARAYTPEVFAEKYADLFDGGPAWDRLKRAPSPLFQWDAASTYIRRPPYFDGLDQPAGATRDIAGARPLAILGHSITTDDISPSGAISAGTPSADFLLEKGVKPADFNMYITRRGNHEVAVRATFANIRLKNRMTPGVEGGVTKWQPDGRVMRIYDAAEKYLAQNTPLVVIAGKNYGCGSSRDWAAKGVALLGVKAVIAEGFERIHRTNLVGMGVLPLQFRDGATAETLGLDGTETFAISGLDADFPVRGVATCTITRADGAQESLPLTLRLDTPEDIAYWRAGGILPFVWRDMADHTAPSQRSA